MNERVSQLTASQMFKELLADPEGRKLFDEAVHSASNKIYNIDRVGRLAAAIESHRYASRRMMGVSRFSNRKRLLRFAVENSKIEGPILEFGVWRGNTINFLAELLPNSKIYGFDAFEGLPDPWFGVGRFARQGEAPQVRDNVELVIGWFDQTLPMFLNANMFDRVALLHIDCDIYSSTQTVLNGLRKRIGPGTIIVFDEYFNYTSWERHEYAAFKEFVEYHQIQYEYIGCVPGGMQVGVRILTAPCDEAVSKHDEAVAMHKALSKNDKAVGKPDDLGKPDEAVDKP